VVYLETKAVAAAEQQVGGDDLMTGMSSMTNGSEHAESPLIDSVPKSIVASPISPRNGAAQVDREAFKILLVEDNLINQRVLNKQLRKAKCTVTIANHGAEALEILKQSTYWKYDTLGDTQAGVTSDPVSLEVVLMDIEMPVMNGLQCTKQIRLLQDEGVIAGHIPIIATTANARQEQKDIIFAAGVDRILVKPFTIEELMLSIRELIV
jgi:CheY-like chemotaxis protein